MGDILTGDLLAHLAFALLVGALLVHSLRRVRILTCAAGLAALAYFAMQGSGLLWIGWAAIIVIVAGVQLAIAARRSRSGELLPAERDLFEHVMDIRDPKHRRRMRDLLRWQDVAAGEVLMRQGQPEPPLIYVAQGTASIESDGQPVGTCGKGDFLGEMSVVSGAGASATVTAEDAMRIARIDRDALAQLARSVPEIGTSLDAALNRSLAAKVLRMNRSATGGGEGAG